MYDAIVVGARCAGSPTAMLLARAGRRVLLVDRAGFPSDTLSTHFIHQSGAAHLERWGLLPQVVAAGAAPSHSLTLDIGPFTLRATFTPAVCGDGIVAGEACDDGNQVDGDGCSADCSTVEWPNLCAAMPTLSTASPNSGSTVGAPNLVNTDGYCTSIQGSAGERMFQFTAPSQGLLSLSLPETSANRIVRGRRSVIAEIIANPCAVGMTAAGARPTAECCKVVARHPRACEAE